MATINGTDGNDTLAGSDANDSINGLAGNDTLRGGGGADSLYGGAGEDDWLFGDSGNDYLQDSYGLMSGGAGDDTLDGTSDGLSDGFVDADYGQETGTAGITVNLAIGRATDTFGNADTLINIKGVIATSRADYLVGGISDELFRGMAGNDTIDGGAGWDEVHYRLDAGAGGTAGVTVNLLTGLAVDGFGNTDQLISIERVRGSGLADLITGNADDNRFRGLGGNDSMAGGAGWDTLDYSVDARYGGAAGVTVNLATGLATDGSGDTDSFTSMEAVKGTNFGDTLVGDDVANRLEGLSGDDNLNGNGGNDTLLSGGGDDRLTGGTGNDSLDGGDDGRFGDTVDYSSSTVGVVVNLTTGTASDGLGGTDTLLNIEHIAGTAFADNLVGSSKNNWFMPGAGDDTIDGVAPSSNNPNTVMYGDASAGVVINLALGVADGSSIGHDILLNIWSAHGSDFDDQITLSNNNGYTFAQAGNDSVNGGTQGEYINGGTGNDTLIGGGGYDSAAYTLGATRVDGLTLSGTAASGWTVSRNGQSLIGVQANTATGHWTVTDLRTSAPNDGPMFGVDVLSEMETINLEGVDGAGASLTASLTLEGTQSSPVLGLRNQVGTAGDDLLNGTNSSDTIKGLAGNDTVMGNLGGDLLYGGPGNDVLNGGEQRNLTWKSGRYYATGDYDNAVYSDLSAGGIRIDLSSMTVTGINGADMGTDTLRGVEAVRGSRQADSLVGSLLTLAGSNEAAGDQHGLEFVGYGGNDSITQGSVVGNAPWLDGVFAAYWWSDAAVSAAFNGTSGTVSYGAAGSYQLAGADTLQNISSIGDTRLSDLFDFSGFSSSTYASYYAGTKGMYVDLSVGNDTVVGNGETTVNLSGTLTSSNGLGVNAVMAAAGAVFSIEMSHLSNNGQVVGVKTLSGIVGLRGTAFNDTLVGGANDAFTESFRGKGGDDLIDGKGGTDRAEYLGSSSGVTVNLAAGTATGDSSIGTDTLRSIEAIRGTQLDDVFDARGFSGTSINAGSRGEYNIFEGRGGNDTIYGNGSTRIVYTTSIVAMDVNLAAGTAQALDPENRMGDMGLVVGQDTFSGVYRVSGSALGDLLVGGGAGRGFGETQLESFDPGAGNDSVNGGAGWDSVIYFDAPAAISIDLNLPSGQIQDGYGNVDTVISIEEFVGTTFNDTMRGSDANPAGQESFNGQKGNDLIDGRGGYDEVGYSDDINGVTVNLATGVATDGWGGTDTLISIEGVEGSSFNDSITGSDADNRLDGHGGNDTLDGGAGIDTAEYNNESGAVQVNLAMGTATGAAGSDILIRIENVHGTLYGDTLTGDTNANRLEGRDGNDTLSGAAGNDTLLGGSGQDWLAGGQGDDSLDGGSNDVFFGRDWVEYSGATGSVQVNLGTNSASGADGNDTLAGFEAISGSAYADGLTGDGGNNVLRGNGGNDTMDGGDGFDQVDYGMASGSVMVSLVTQTASGFDGNDVFSNIEGARGGQAGDVITGNSQNNNIRGNGGNDTLDGGAGVDTVDYWLAPAAVTVNLASGFASGGDGADTLSNFENIYGSQNYSDSLVGNDLDNKFWGVGGDDTIQGNGGYDTAVYDFGDTLVDNMQRVANGTNSWLLSQSGNNLVGLQFNAVTGYWSVADLRSSVTGGSVNFGTDYLIGVELLTGNGKDSAGNMSSGTLYLSSYQGQGVVNGTNNIQGTVGNDYLLGTGTHDTLSGLAGNDTLISLGGNDTLYGGSGDDLLNGGEQRNLTWKSGRYYATGDYDTAAYNDVTGGGIRLDLSSMTVTGQGGASTTVGADTLRGIEAVRGTKQSDSVVGTLPSGGNEGAGDQHSVDFIGYGGTDSIAQAQINNNPWVDGVFAAYWWSETAINVSFSGSTGTVTYGANSTTQVTGSDTLQNIPSIGDSNFSDTVNFSGMTGGYYSSYYAGSKSNYIDLNLGNDTVVGNGETTVNFNSTNTSTTGLGVNAVMAALGGVFTVDLTHLKHSNGTANGVKTLSGVNGLRGTNFNDTLVGGGNDSTTETFRGKGGDDLINGLGGTDRADYLGSSSGVSVNLAAGTATGDSSIGNDTLRSIEAIRGTQLDDIFDARGFSGTSANAGSRGEYNMFEGRGGNDTIFGNGSTRIVYTTSMVALDVNLATGVAQAMDPAARSGDMGLVVGQDTFFGVYRVSGSALGDLLVGGGTGRRIGETKHEAFDPGAGNDTINGMGDWDSVIYFDAPSAISIDLNLPTGQIQDGYGHVDTVISVEEFVGTIYNDTMRGSDANLAGQENFNGQKGNDLIDGRGGYDEVGYNDDISGVNVNLATGIGTDGWGGTDTLISIEGFEGSAFNDLVIGSNADNRLDGRGGNDTLDGGAGIDTAEYNNDSGAVQVNLALGTATGAAGNDTLIRIENVHGTIYSDTLTGDANANRFTGSAGNDTIDGADGIDTAVYSGNRANYTVTVSASGVSVTDNRSIAAGVNTDGTDTLTHIEQLVFADQTQVLADVAQLHGIAYHWKSHMLLQDVAINGTSGSGVGDAAFQFKNVGWDATGHFTADVFAHSTAGFQNLNFEVHAGSANSITFAASTALPSDWTVVSNVISTSGNLRVAGLGINSNLPAGDIKVGTMTGTFATVDHVSLQLVSGKVGAANVSSFLLTGERTLTDSLGAYSVMLPENSSYAITASRGAVDAVSAIDSLDALSALKIGVNINPNPDPDGVGVLSSPMVSPYQIMAADVNGSGTVTALDALAILRMSVELPGSPAKEWLFVEETRDFWDEAAGKFTLDRNQASWDHSITGSTTVLSNELNLVGVLKGDVDGSWEAPVGSVALDTGHFETLHSVFGIPMAQWGG